MKQIVNKPAHLKYGGHNFTICLQFLFKSSFFFKMLPRSQILATDSLQYWYVIIKAKNGGQNYSGMKVFPCLFAAQHTFIKIPHLLVISIEAMKVAEKGQRSVASIMPVENHE